MNSRTFFSQVIVRVIAHFIALAVNFIHRPEHHVFVADHVSITRYGAQVRNPAKTSLLSRVQKLCQVLRSIRSRTSQQPPYSTSWSPEPSFD